MKNVKREKAYYFVDEAGDSAFYNRHGEFIVGREGCSKIIMLGFIETDEPKTIRKELQKVRDKIKNDPYLKDVPSLEKTLCYFHATDDCPEVRQEVYKCISALNFKSQFVIARKIEGVFKSTIAVKINFMTRLYGVYFRIFCIGPRIILFTFPKEDQGSGRSLWKKPLNMRRAYLRINFLLRSGQKFLYNRKYPQMSLACR